VAYDSRYCVVPEDFLPEVTQWGLGMTHGVLFGVPIPESYAAVGKELQEAVEQAIRESQENGMDKQGKQVTPWLLERVRQLTSGKSLASSECVSILLLQPDEWPPLCRYRTDREHSTQRGPDSSCLC